MTIINIFLGNKSRFKNDAMRLGESYFWIGDDPGDYSTNLTQNPQALYDTGSYEVTPPLTGKYVVVRRSGIANQISGEKKNHPKEYNILELRVF